MPTEIEFIGERGPYVPSEHQRRFHNSRAQWRAFIGGIRSGKTCAGSIEALMMACGDYQGQMGMIVAPTYTQLMDSTRAEFDRWLPADIVRRYVVSPRPEVDFHNGSRIIMRSADEPQSLLGTTLAWFLFDEAAICRNRRAWDILMGRVLSTQGRGMVVTTPKGLTWLYDEFVRHATERHELVTCRTVDNPIIDPADIEALRRSYSPELAAQELDAQFIEGWAGLVYSQFRHDIHVARCEYDPKLPLYLDIDWGYTNPTVVLFMQADAMDRIRVIHELRFTQLTGEETAERVKAFLAERKWPMPRQCYPDPSGAGEMAAWRKRGFQMVPMKSDVSAGIEAVRQAMRVREDKLPGLLIDPGCQALIEEITRYQYAEGQTDRNPDKQFDHGPDALRYGVSATVRAKALRPRPKPPGM